MNSLEQSIANRYLHKREIGIPQISDRDIAAVKHALRGHQGKQNRITVEALTAQVYGEFTATFRRRLRAVIHEINTNDKDNLLILTDVGNGGVWTADTDPEPAVTFYHSEHNRAMALLEKTAAMGRKIERLYGREALRPQPGQDKLL